MTKSKLLKSVASIGAGLVLFAGSAMAASSFMKLQPKKYDPDRTRAITSKWQARVGLNDAPKGNANMAVFLRKQGATLTNASADLNIKGVEGKVLTGQIGFAYRNDSHCTGGAPRINVETDAGKTYFYGCSGGTHTVEAAGWTRVRFNPLTQAQQGPMAPTEKVTFMQILLDEGTDQGNPGFAYIDNVFVNGVTMGAPGAYMSP